MIRTFRVLCALLSLLLVLFAGTSFSVAANSEIVLFAGGSELGIGGQIAWAVAGATLVTLAVVFWILAFYEENKNR